MKKILALMLAALMLLSMAALAETAENTPSTLMLGLSNVNATITDGEGNTNEIALPELNLSGILGTKDGVQFVLQADRGDEFLCCMNGKIEDGKVIYTTSASERAYEYVIPATPGIDVSSMPEQLGALLPALVSMKLPQLPAVSLPKADLSGLVAMLDAETTEENGVATTNFSVSAETISSLLDYVTMMLQYSASSVPQLDQVTQLLNQLKESGLSFTLEGSIQDTAEEQAASVTVYMTSNGETAETPTLFLNTYSAEDKFTLAVDVPYEDSSYTVGQLSVTTDPAAETINVGVDLAGMVTLNVDFYKQDGLQVAELKFDAMGQSINLALSYGTRDGNDYTSLTGNFADQANFSLETNAQASDQGTSGTINCALTAPGIDASASADYFEYLDDFDLSAYTIPEEIVPNDQFTQEEAQAAIQPLMDYINEAVGMQPAA